MKVLKAILKCLFWVLILALLVAPLGLIYEISNREMEAYQAPEVPKLKEMAYGEVVQAQRTDILEYLTVSGKFTSDTFAYMELDYRYPNRIRWHYGVGDEVQEGQVLGTYNGKEILSQYTGIISEMNYYDTENSYIKINLLSPVVLECNVSSSTLSSLRRSEELTLSGGQAVTLLYAAQVRNPDGTTKVKLSIDNDRYYYGQELEKLDIYTGNKYMQALVLPADCLYQTEPGEDNPWYARKVTAEGQFMQEVEVGIGYSNGYHVCVTGVGEGDYFDAGYAEVVKGGS